MLSIREKIKKFIEKHGDVDQSYFPSTVIYWTGKKDGEECFHIYDVTHGKVDSDVNAKLLTSVKESLSRSRFYPNYQNDIEYAPNAYYCMGYAGQNIKALYIKTDNVLKVMEVSQCFIDTHRYNSNKYDVKRVWERDPYTTTAYFVNGPVNPPCHLYLYRVPLHA